MLNKLTQGDAEFLLQRAADGKLRIRTGRIWTIPTRHGTSMLTLDFDDTKRISTRSIRERLLRCGVICDRITTRTSPGGNGIHAVVWIRGRFRQMDCIALEAILESDPARSAENFRRLTQGGKEWEKYSSVLFAKKEKVK